MNKSMTAELLRIPREQFYTRVSEHEHDHFRWTQLLALLPALIIFVLLIWKNVIIANRGELFAASSIMTGVTFTMATLFWNKSVDARHDMNYMLDGKILRFLDQTRTHLLYTATVGMLTIFSILTLSIFSPPSLQEQGPVLLWLGRTAAALVVYLMTLVSRAITLFADAFYQLKG